MRLFSRIGRWGIVAVATVALVAAGATFAATRLHSSAKGPERQVGAPRHHDHHGGRGENGRHDDDHDDHDHGGTAPTNTTPETHI